MIITITGMMRSGSTWSYNVARLIAQSKAHYQEKPFSAGYFEGEGLDEAIEEAAKKGVIAVMKSHYPTETAVRKIMDGEIKNICTVRDPRDCVVSRQQFQDDETLDHSISLVKSNIVFVQAYTQSPTMFLKYENITNNNGWVRGACDYLGVSLSKEEMLWIFNETSVEKAQEICARFDDIPEDQLVINHGHRVEKNCLLHENHIQDGKVGKWVDHKEAERINMELSQEVKFLGYGE